MKNDAERMIAMLSPAIEEKCQEIHEAKRAKTSARVFVFLCIAALLLPTLFVFCGFSLITLVIPVAFVTVAILLLSPILIHQQGGHTYEQA